MKSADHSLCVAVFSASVLAALPLFAEPLKVLMIGNSFSHSVLVQLPKIAHDNGDELLIENLMIPGCTLVQHAENIAKAEKDAAYKPYNCDRKVDGKQLPRRKVNIQEALAEEKWDVVTIQQGSSKCFDAAAYHPCGEEVLATIRKLAPQAKILFQVTWSYNERDADGFPPYYTFATLYRVSALDAPRFSGRGGEKRTPGGIQAWTH